MARVAHYIRVSTEEQGKFGYSVREQLHTLKAHSKSHDDEVVEESADEGFSGASLKGEARRRRGRADHAPPPQGGTARRPRHPDPLPEARVL